MDIDNLTVEDLFKIVDMYGGENVAVCIHCITIQEIPHREDVEGYQVNEKEYPSTCDKCCKVFPRCCIQKIMHSDSHYSKHPEHLIDKDGVMCRSCIKKRSTEKMEKKHLRGIKNAKKKKKPKKEVECSYCLVSTRDGDDNNVFPLSRCKKCDCKVCKWCFLNGLCISCHEKLGTNTKGLKVGNRVIFLGEDSGPPTLTEATVLKIYHEAKEVKIRCDRHNDGDYKPQQKIERVWRKLLRKI